MGLDKAEVIGDSVEVMRQSYAKLITVREKRLTKILQDAFRHTEESKREVEIKKQEAAPEHLIET